MAVTPNFPPATDPTKTIPSEPANLKAIIDKLGFRPHIEGGYFVETDRSPLRIPNPFTSTTATGLSASHALQSKLDATGDKLKGYNESASTRAASTSILYLLTPANPQGYFHRNASTAIHSLVWGRGTYVVIHPDGAREVFDVGRDVLKGERVQWIVQGGCWKASFLRADEGGEGSERGVLVSETVAPGFEFEDHEFLTAEKAKGELGDGWEELKWLVRSD